MKPGPKPHTGPTPRQKEIILLMLQGLQYKEIAYKMGLSNRATVWQYLKALRIRINAPSTYAAIGICFRKGWVS